jgi:hypothetical protein
MGALAIIMLVFLLGIFLMMLLAIWAMNKVAPRVIGDKHDALQTIVATRQVPAGWPTPFVRKGAGLTKESAAPERVDAIEQQAEERYLEQLDGLIAHAGRSALVAGEETRQTLLDELASVRSEWQARYEQEL